MIKVNLLHGAQRAGGLGGAAEGGFDSLADEDYNRRQGLPRLLLIMLPVFAMYLYEFYNIPSLRDERNKLSRSLNELKTYNAQQETAVKEIKRFKADEERIQQRISALERMSRNRMNEIKVLKLIADVIPEKAWMTKVEVRNGKASLIGMALSNSDVNVLAERLKSNILIADLQQGQIKEEKLDGRIHTKFEFSCLLEAKQ